MTEPLQKAVERLSADVECIEGASPNIATVYDTPNKRYISDLARDLRLVLAALPGSGDGETEPVDPYGPLDNSQLFAAALSRPQQPAPEVREAVARIVDPAAWEFADKFRSKPTMAAEIKYETKPSLGAADAILALPSLATPAGEGGE